MSNSTALPARSTSTRSQSMMVLILRTGANGNSERREAQKRAEEAAQDHPDRCAMVRTVLL